jgi:hypothetical protein
MPVIPPTLRRLASSGTPYPAAKPQSDYNFKHRGHQGRPSAGPVAYPRRRSIEQIDVFQQFAKAARVASRLIGSSLVNCSRKTANQNVPGSNRIGGVGVDIVNVNGYRSALPSSLLSTILRAASLPLRLARCSAASPSSTIG